MRGWRHRRQPPEDEQTPGSASDAELVRVSLSNISAFTPLYLRYRDDVLRYCYYCLGDWEEAEEATQEIFLSAFRGLSRLGERDDAFSRYLWRTAHNEVYDRRNCRRRRSTVPLAEAFDVEDSAPSLEHRAVIADDHSRVLALLDRLPPDRREVCELKFAHRSDQEIAGILGKSEGAVRVAWSRSAAQLRDLMGISLTPKGGGDA